MPFFRTKAMNVTNPSNSNQKLRTPIQHTSSFLDANFLYGRSVADANTIRVGRGQIRETAHNSNTDATVALIGRNLAWRLRENAGIPRTCPLANVQGMNSWFE